MTILTEFQFNVLAYFVVGLYLLSSIYSTLLILKHQPKLVYKALLIFVVWYFPFLGSIIYAITTFFTKHKDVEYA